ncbi:shikimate dehydrogenase [Paucilactobacillus kaifaensis]|uniref:shikimate dehydrogenase n=1 Tax=Paucilactobacillus kaifaensis TaxID=2559921 RepID=UPI001CC49ED2|nr:shikimate dehydrogenase [Paucilactobacillus kaifaensis]
MNEINGKTRLFGFFAHPAQHSLSPLMYNVSFDELGLNARYLAFDIQPSEIKQAVQAIRTLNLAGANLSMPFKQAVIPLLDEITPRAHQLQSVNVILNQAGRLIGDSVDGQGFFESLTAQKIKFKKQRIAVLGVGGAGRSIIQAAINNQISQIDVFKRKNETFIQRKEQLHQLAKGSDTEVNLIDYEDQAKMKHSLARSHLVINTTNLGMGTKESQMPVAPDVLNVLDGNQVVCDVIYSPRETKFLRFAQQRGCQTINGLGMLIHQGALSFKWWTNEAMPINEVTQAINNQLTQTKKAGI